MLLLCIFAFLAGIATVLSPCVLPVLPAILSASASGGKRRPLGVIFGLALSFVFFTLTLTALVQSFGISANVLRNMAIGFIALFGCILLIPWLSDRFARLTNSIGEAGANFQNKFRPQSSGFMSGFLIGCALGLVWTPCAGPILAAVTTLVATQSISWKVIAIAVAYSLGSAVPLFFIAYGSQRALRIPSIAKHAEKIRQCFGALMLLTALALAFGWDALLQQSVLEYFPTIQIEKNPLVEQELQNLRSTSPFKVKQGETATGANGQLPFIAPSPPIEGITAWINSEPLAIDELKGKVVLIDFWTYSCINCIRTFPYLRKWYDEYKDKGLVIIGVHTPEFEFEKEISNVKKAVERFSLKYPIAMDNHYKTWGSFKNFYWPAHYLIDQNGIVREVHFGEGGYLETENAIRSLLHLLPLSEKGKEIKTAPSLNMTPETYLGYKRAAAYPSRLKIERGIKANYHYSAPLAKDEVALNGEWRVGAEYIESLSDDAFLSLNFKAKRVYLVLSGRSSKPIVVKLDGKALPSRFWTKDMDSKGKIEVNEARKYDIVDLLGIDSKEEEGRHLLTLDIPKGIQAYAFTFGMEEEGASKD